MNHDINDLPRLKEIESDLFGELQAIFQKTLLSVLEEIDAWLMEHPCFGNSGSKQAIWASSAWFSWLLIVVITKRLI